MLLSHIWLQSCFLAYIHSSYHKCLSDPWKAAPNNTFHFHPLSLKMPVTYNSDSHEVNRRKINRLKSSPWPPRSFSWLTSHPDEHHLKALPSASSLCLCLPHPNWKRHTRTCCPALFLSDCHVTVTTGHLSHRESRVYPTLILPCRPTFPQISSSWLMHTCADSPEGFIQALWTASITLSAQLVLWDMATYTAPHAFSVNISYIQSTAFAQQCLRAASNEPLWLGAWKQQDHPSHPFVPSPTELYWCWTNNLGIIIKHTPAKQLWWI